MERESRIRISKKELRRIKELQEKWDDRFKYVDLAKFPLAAFLIFSLNELDNYLEADVNDE